MLFAKIWGFSVSDYSAKSLIHDIYRAETEKKARTAYQRFQDRYRAKYPKAVENLMKDETSLFTF
ncbi:hypothetical protein FGF68_10050 [Prosthecochloris vibrioformis]|uniref:Uncharacterized protein n=1 Tax=Prosthecochloris vibrioformis TaxID=1098 RepID=A0A5C4RS87_PROVB|nr:hypothetical protein FGF68_10050 [Prosthecochloris vibrioformis]